MTVLQRLYAEYGQGPWLDNLTPGHVRDGTLLARDTPGTILAARWLHVMRRLAG